MSSPLTTTHHALLSLLSTRSASAYDLVREMGRSVGHVWPRAQSNLYADLKRLAQEGLASSSVSHTGKRARTTYRITARGRRALSAWLEDPGDPPVFECSALLKLAFAPSSTKESALAQVDVLARHAEERIALGRSIATEYVDDGGPLPERLHINAVMWRYLWEMHHATARWAEWARAEIEAWPDTGDHPASRLRGVAALRAGLDAHPR